MENLLLLIFFLQTPKTLKDVRVWTFNQSIHSPSRVDSVIYFEPQYAKRGWFKYNHIPFNYFPFLSVIPPLLNGDGVIFEGGVQVANISPDAGWPYDNPYDDDHQPPYELPEPVFDDFVTRDPDGNIYWIPNIYGNSVTCASIGNENYLNYVLFWAQQQVRAKVNALEFDEINGGYLFSQFGVNGNNPNTGYDDYMIGVANLATRITLIVRGDSLIWDYPEGRASSEINPAYYAFDEDPSTEWISDTGDFHWIELDLKGEKTLRQIYFLLDPENLLQEFDVQYYDGETWQEFEPPINITFNDDSVLSFLVSPVKSQKIRLISNDSQVFLREFQVYSDGFRQWLIQKYVVEEGWTPTDPRWESEKLVDLNNPDLCPDGTINTFNYREYLRIHNWSGNPFGGNIDSTNYLNPPNPFFLEWGAPQYFRSLFSLYFGDPIMRDSVYQLFCESFSFKKISDLWEFLTDGIRNLAEDIGCSIYLTFNGSAGNPALSADYRLNPLGWGRGLFPVYSEPDPIDTQMLHLDGFEAQVNLWRMKKDWALSSGDTVPIVAFLDFGHQGFPFSHLGGSPELGFSADERAEYLSVYPFEIYASGVKFCFPIWEPHFNAYYDTLSNGNPISDIIKRGTEFINQNWEIYKDFDVNPLEGQVKINGIVPFNGEWHIENGRIHSPVNESKVTVAYTDSPNGIFSYLHIMNHNWDSISHRFEPQYDIDVYIPTQTRPFVVFTISPEDSDTVYLPFEYQENAVNLTLPSLHYYRVIVLQYLPTSIISKTKISYHKIKLIAPSIFTKRLPLALFVPVKTEIKIFVYNSAGRLIKNLFSNSLEEGIYRLYWDGVDERGLYLPTGVYFLRLEAGGYKDVIKVLKLGK
jgi:hypothetical protein